MRILLKIFLSLIVFVSSAGVCFADNSAHQQTIELVNTYYNALNNKNMNQFFAIITPNVIHDINQGGSEQGIGKFKLFMQQSNNSFDEKLSHIIIMVSNDGNYATGQWIDHGTYYRDFPGMGLKAKNQKYILRGANIFEITNGKISRVTTYFNEAEFMTQVKNQ